MRLFNTLTNNLTDLETLGLKPGDEVTLYSCGPTVYNHVHIGNLRTFIMDDLLRRSLTAAGYRVRSVMNITDVDDKTIAKSQEEHPDLGPMEALAETTRHYEDIFKHDLEAVGVDLSQIKFVRATDSIPQMQALIEQIYDRGFAYVADGSVYFDLKKYRETGNTYGVLTNVDYSPQARIDNDEYEKNEARDFVLWKGAKDGEPFWEFTLGEHDLPGRPGWHIECSAMALDNLGQPLMIHSGGIDLKFPHHENEIAQVVGATGQEFAKIFVHHNHLFVDGRKMSKSLDNFYTLEDIKAKGYHPLAFRLLSLQAQHTSELNFTWESLEAAQNRVLALHNFATLRYQVDQASGGSFDPTMLLFKIDALKNDLDSPTSMAEVADYMDAVYKADLRDERFTLNDYLDNLESAFSLGLLDTKDIDKPTSDLIAERETARKDKDWIKSDKIRAKLAGQHIEIDDTPNGPRWRRTIIE